MPAPNQASPGGTRKWDLKPAAHDVQGRSPSQPCEDHGKGDVACPGRFRRLNAPCAGQASLSPGAGELFQVRLEQSVNPLVLVEPRIGMHEAVPFHWIRRNFEVVLVQLDRASGRAARNPRTARCRRSCRAQSTDAPSSRRQTRSASLADGRFALGSIRALRELSLWAASRRSGQVRRYSAGARWPRRTLGLSVSNAVCRARAGS